MRLAARILLATAATALAGAAPQTALAQTADAGWNDAGHFQVKVLATAVLPLGHVSSVPDDTAGLVKGNLVTQTKANDNYVPTVALEYFLNKNISFETICCLTGHHVTVAAGGLAGTPLVTNIQIIPATLTAKYHFTGLGPKFVPYVGVGPSVFIIVADRPTTEAKGLGVTRTKLSTEPTVAVQAGIDAPLNKHWALTIDAKKYFDKTTAHFYGAAGQVEAVRVRLMPWVVSAGVGYRF